MIEIYHNPRCRKSRAGLKFLEEHVTEIKVVDYIKNPITEDELSVLLMKLNKKPMEMIRTQEDYFKHELKGRQFNDNEWVRVMVESPKLIKRPIVVKGNKAVWGDPAENIQVLLK